MSEADAGIAKESAGEGVVADDEGVAIVGVGWAELLSCSRCRSRQEIRALEGAGEGGGEGGGETENSIVGRVALCGRWRMSCDAERGNGQGQMAFTIM